MNMAEFGRTRMTEEQVNVVLFVTGYLAGCLTVMALLWPTNKSE